MQLGKAIKSIRTKLGLTQQQTCDRSQLTQGFYSSIENGTNNPSIDALQRICETFNIPIFLVIWAATEKKEIPNNFRQLFNNLNPIIKDTIDETIK